MTRLWREHSLTIVLWAIGIPLTAAAWLLEPGKGFDTILSLGAGVLTVALFYTASNFLREVAKPEE